MAKRGMTNDFKLHDFIVNNITYKCSCSHSVVILKDKALCNHCNKWVFKNKEDEFKYRMNEQMKKK